MCLRILNLYVELLVLGGMGLFQFCLAARVSALDLQTLPVFAEKLRPCWKCLCLCFFWGPPAYRKWQEQMPADSSRQTKGEQLHHAIDPSWFAEFVVRWGTRATTFDDILSTCAAERSILPLYTQCQSMAGRFLRFGLARLVSM